MHQTPDQHKSEVTRIRAYEKEIARLKAVSARQSQKYSRLKKFSFFLLIFFLVLLVMMAFYGLLSWPSGGQQTADPVLTAPKADSLTLPADTTDTSGESHLSHLHDEEWLAFPIPENGILFQVQIGAFTGIDLQPFALNMLSLRQYHYENINQFTAGLFVDFESARSFRDLLQQMGFTDAYVTATLHGKRIAAHEARKLKAAAPENTPEPEALQSPQATEQQATDSVFMQEVSLP